MGYSDFKGLITKENETFRGHLAAEDVNLVINIYYNFRKNYKINWSLYYKLQQLAKTD